MNIKKMLTGRRLPDYEALACCIFWTATGQSVDKIRQTKGKDSLFYLIYEQNRAFQRSSESALNSDCTARIAKQKQIKKKAVVVFATHKLMRQKELAKMKIIFH